MPGILRELDEQPPQARFRHARKRLIERTPARLARVFLEPAATLLDHFHREHFDMQRQDGTVLELLGVLKGAERFGRNLAHRAGFLQRLARRALAG